MYNFWNPNPGQGSINWVQGLEGAKSVPISPNGSAVLMDAVNDGIFYIKSVDNIGMSTIRKFKYEEILNEQPVSPAAAINAAEYVRKDELEALIKEALRNESIIRADDIKPAKTKS